MLQEQELKTFVEGTTNYFEVAAQQPASIGSPYLTDSPPSVHDYTGIISISGKREGVVYFTAPKAMLTVLLMKMQENDFSHETMRDLVGEDPERLAALKGRVVEAGLDSRGVRLPIAEKRRFQHGAVAREHSGGLEASRAELRAIHERRFGPLPAEDSGRGEPGAFPLPAFA